jgi:hypothetical protein
MADEVELVPGAGDSAVTEFATYEDYLDSQITPIDLFYLEVCPQRVILRTRSLLVN